MSDASSFAKDWEAVRVAVGSVLVGQDDVVEGVLTALFAGGHVLLEGVPGLGKTLLVRTLGAALGLDFRRIQFTPDLMPADVTGTTVVEETEQGRSLVFRRGPVFTQLLLADEINRATPKTQSAMLEAMQERSVTVGGVTHELPAPFMVMATQNPVEQEGTYPLPEAQLDRFLFKLIVPTTGREDLVEILRRTTGAPQPDPTPVLDGDRLLAHQRAVRSVEASDETHDYAARLVLATHPGHDMASPEAERWLRFGASPRAAQALLLAGKVRALRDGRTMVEAEDLVPAALPALRHRLHRGFEAEAEGVDTDQVVKAVLETVPQHSVST